METAGQKAHRQRRDRRRQFGFSVAIASEKGKYALIGGPGDNKEVGAAWVFLRSGTTWAQQGKKLMGSGESGAGDVGGAVALSGTGEYALLGGWRDNAEVGAAWVFPRSGATWTQQGEKLTGGGEADEGESSGKGAFGFSVALSPGGEYALIGGPGDSGKVGAAWVFLRSGTTWAQQGKKLTGGEETGAGEFGESVAISEKGEYAVIGGPSDNGRAGAAWVFLRSGTAWAQQGKKLTGGEETGEGEFGDERGDRLGQRRIRADRRAWRQQRSRRGVGVPAHGQRPGLSRAKSSSGSEESGEGQFGDSVALSTKASTR